jgi:hypothetical protein
MRNLLSLRLRSLNLFFLLGWLSYELARFCDNYDRMIMQALQTRPLSDSVMGSVGLRRGVNVILIIF